MICRFDEFFFFLKMENFFFFWEIEKKNPLWNSLFQLREYLRQVRRPLELHKLNNQGGLKV